jgi:(1->4)-alpha-D-glucan 1-alpha-D-glucosylmutase
MNRNVPLATYRLQFNSNFQFRDAIGILDYLRELGISHIYASPVFTSRRGSGHGYDVTDPTRIDPDLGGEQGFAELQTAIEERNMRLLLDIVPNHMAASSENRWWMDVLEFGPDSSFASYFDINWRTPSRSLENKLLLPFLAKPFGEVLDGGELRITHENGRLFLRYQEQTFPIAPGSYAEILRYREHDLNLAVEMGSPAEQEWHGIVAAAESIASDRGVSAQAATERRTKAEHLRERLRQLIGGSPQMAAFLELKETRKVSAGSSASSPCSIIGWHSGRQPATALITAVFFPSPIWSASASKTPRCSTPLTKGSFVRAQSGAFPGFA